MFHWRSFSEWGSDRGWLTFGHTGSQYVGYASQRPHQLSISILVRPKIVDAVVTLCFKIMQWPWHFLLFLSRLPIRWLGITVTKLMVSYISNKTKNCWYSVDTQFQNGAANISLSPQGMTNVNPLIKHYSDQVNCQLPHLEGQISLMLCWLPVSE